MAAERREGREDKPKRRTHLTRQEHTRRAQEAAEDRARELYLMLNPPKDKEQTKK